MLKTRRYLKLTSFFLVVCMLFCTVEPVNIFAKSSSYKSIYKTFLNNGDHSYEYFNIVDIDKSGVPELIVEQDLFAMYIDVYTVKSGKIKYLGEVKKGSGDEVAYNQKEKGFVSPYGGSGAVGYGLWKIKNGKMKEAVEVYAFFHAKTTYEKNYKSCNKKTYQAAYNKYFKPSKLKHKKFKKINSKNIKSILKV